SMAVSADGAYLYGTRRTVSPSGIRVYRLPTDGKDLMAQTVANIHDEAPSYIPDSTGAYVASGTRLYTSDWKAVPDAPQTPILAFFPDRPLALGMAGNELVFYSENSLKEIGRASLTEVAPARGAARGTTRGTRGFGMPMNSGTVVLPDIAHESVYVIQGSTATAINLKDVTLPKEPFLF